MRLCGKEREITIKYLDDIRTQELVNEIKSRFASVNDDISDINDAVLSAPLNHNGIFRGKDLTNIYTVSQIAAMVSSGNFDDLYLGDYFTVSITTDIYNRFVGSSFVSGRTYYEASGTINDRTWTATSDTVPQSGKVYATRKTLTENVDLMFAGFDWYYNSGYPRDSSVRVHHAVLTLKNMIFDQIAKMNATGGSAGGYYNSDLHQYILPCYAKSLNTALGGHLITFKSRLTNSIDAAQPAMSGAGLTGAANSADWADTKLQLMNEVQVFGTSVWTSSAYDITVDNRVLPVYRYITPIQYTPHNIWLRSVASSTDFAYFTTQGNCNHISADTSVGVSPMMLFG